MASSRTTRYNCQRTIVMIITTLGMVAAVAGLILRDKIAKYLVENANKPTNIHDLKIIILALLGVTLAIQIAGFIGAWKEVFCLALIYAIACCFGVAGNAMQIIMGHPNYISLVTSILWALTAIGLAIDIRKHQRNNGVNSYKV